MALLNSVFALVAAASLALAQTSFTFNPPLLQPFIHAEARVGIPTNTSTFAGTLGRFANGPGNITGEITGTVVPIGAANELVPANTDGSHSFLTNQYTINTTAPAESTLIMDVQAIINYANEALYGLYKVQFLGPLDVFGEDIIFGTFVASMQSEFETGRGILDVWRVVPNGRIDGQAIPALLPPGQSE